MVMEKLDRKNIEDILALTPMQTGMLFHYLKDSGKDYYFEQLILDISGNIEPRLFERAWNRVIERNEMLRTLFRWEKMKAPSQIVLKRYRIKPVYIDLSDKKGIRQQNAMEEVKRNDRKEKFNLSRVPFRVTLCKLGEDHFLMIISNHHILYDGWSNGIILKEFFEVYEALSGGDEFLPISLPPKTKFKEYVKWITEQDRTRQKEYWTGYLKGIETGTHFPIEIKSGGGEFQGSEDAGGTGSTLYHAAFSNHITEKLEKFVKKYKVTTASLLYSAWGVLLHRYTNRDDVLFGTTVSGRSIDVKDVENIVGLFINTLPLRVTTYPPSQVANGKEKILHLLVQIKEILQQREIHQCTPLVDIKNYSQVPDKEELFNTIVVIENYPLDRGLSMENHCLTLQSYSMVGTPNYDLAIGFLRADTLEVTIGYHHRAIHQNIIDTLWRHLQQIITYMLSHPEHEIDAVDMLSEQEKNKLLLDFNDTAAVYGRDKTIHELFQQQVQKTPDTTAVIFEDNRLAYDELNQEANRLAYRLRLAGVKPGTIVGILLMPSIERVVAMLGILKAGGAYLPLDPEIPRQRLVSMLEDCQVPVVISDSGIVGNKWFTPLKSLYNVKVVPGVTVQRPQIINLDGLPLPDRSLVNYDQYMDKIGQAWVKHCIAIFSTRGCPFKCAYCHRIWPKKHVVRSAENIFAEVKLYYDMGVRRFAIIDDIFNLDVKNSTRFFELVIKNGLNESLQLFFPNGMRGDLLSKEYLDLMVKAGTVGMGLALETASPRLQKLIQKNLNLKKFRENLEYLCEKHPQVISELYTMHGFPTETEEEALMTLDFIKSVKGIHFPYINILRIYSNTDMYRLAVENGISEKAIFNWENSYFHELPETLPFDKNFTLKVQSDFLQGYFLSKERLLRVLPHQMKIFTEEEMVQKYNSYLMVKVNSFPELLQVTGISPGELGSKACLDESTVAVPNLDEKISAYFPVKKPKQEALKILFLDVSQFFSKGTDRLDVIFDPPLGMILVLSYVNQRFNDRINGKIVKSRVDFDSFSQLRNILEEFQPDIIGMRTLTYYRDFFHQTAALIRQWGFHIPIVAGGPYASSNYNTLLQDRNIDLVVLGEGEITFCELIEKMLENGNRLPDETVLSEIKGLSFIPGRKEFRQLFSREIFMLDEIDDLLEQAPGKDPDSLVNPGDPAYVIFTSGSTGKPKGVIVEHGNVVNNLNWFGKAFNLDKHTNLLQLSDYTFDPSVEDIFGSLVHGATLYLSDKDLILDRERFRRFIMDNEIHIIDHVPTMLDELLGSGERLDSLKAVITGGMRLPESVKDRLVKKGYPLYNNYGPTEITVDALFTRCSAGVVTLGKPIFNTKCYIVDRHHRLVPVGVAGELYVTGDGVARGYLNSPELTAEKFVEQVTGTGDKCRWDNKKFLRGVQGGSFYKKRPPGRRRQYRTGDLARWLPDGNIEFLGRIDRQVKIRGNRVELGEIEKQLQEYRGIKQAVVTARGEEGDKYLCAYIVPLSSQSLSSGELKGYLSLRLPDYMVPVYFVQLEAIPVTPAGKADIRALPEPGKKTGGEMLYTAPRDKMEEKLVEIWAEVLEIEPGRVGIDDDFFNLGGHSLKATRLISKIHKKMDIKIPIDTLFETPTIRGLSGCIAGKETGTFQAIEPAAEKEYYQLSYAQRRLWIICQFESESITYNMVGGFTITGKLNVRAFENAIQSLVDRHQILRTVFINVDGSPKQKIIGNLEYRLEMVDLRQLEEGEKESRITEIFKADGNRAFDLEQGPLFLFKLLRLEEEKYFLIANVHHLINDGWSAGVISEEVSAFYNSYLNSKENPLAPLKLQYKDYSIWHNALVDGHHLDGYGEYWLKKFNDGPNGIELPLDHPRPPVQTFNGGRIFFEINQEQTAGLNRLCVELEATLFMKLLALLAVLLHKYSGSEDIIIGSPIAGRNNTDLHHMIGFLVNTLVYRNPVKAGESFSKLLGGVKQETLACYENQDYPFDLLVEQLGLDRDLSRSPLFNVMMAFNSMDIQAIGLDLEGVTVTNHLSADVFNPGAFDLAINMDETADMIQCQIIYNSDLFDRGSMERMAANFVTLVDNVLTNPEVPIQRLKYIDEKEYEKVIETFNQTEVSFPRLTLREMFEARVEKSPEKIAVVHNDQAVTYDQLNLEINRLAHYLLDEFRLEPRDIVGISLDRSIEMIIAILGVIKTGSGYLAIDPTYPPDRVLHMLTDSNCRLVIVDKSRPCLFEGYEGKIIDIEESWPGICNKSDGNPGVVSRLTDILYVIYTSGSTGTPNGAMLTQGILANLVQWQNTRTSIDSSKRCLQFTSTSFCVSFQEIMITLVSGGELHLIGEIERQDIDYLMDFLSKHRIEILYLPFSYLNFLFNQSSRWGEDFKHSLRHIITAGEQLKITAGLKDFLENNPGIELHNHYGSSEMHVVTSYTLDAAAAAQTPIPPAGKPIANTKIYILDEFNNPVPIGVWGELFVSGSWEVAGYVNNESLTDKKLLKHPLLRDGNKRLYRSGDIGRWGEDGNIHMKGRKDSQVKIRGFRVELSEIESKILAIRNVEDCVVEVKERAGGEKVLVAYVVLDHIKVAEIKKIIKNYLPLYMIPKFVVLETLPLMSNGKVDRDRLPDPDAVEGYGQPVDVEKISALLQKGDFNRELHEMIGDRTALSHQEKMERMIAYFAHQVQDYSMANDKRLKVSDIDIDILGHDEKKQLLDDLQEMEAEERYIADKTLQRLFEEQARKNPDKIAVVGREQGISHSYRELNEKSNQLAHLLRQKSVGPGTAVGLIEELSVDTVIAALAILKAGAAYMVSPPDLPTDKINSLLDEPPVSLLLTRSFAVKGHYFTSLQGLHKGEAKIYKTASRPSIKDFDRIPIPDRSLVDYEEYNKYIGISIVKNCMALQATRGCPYKCAYCHKIWPKQHVYRSAENIYEEVALYYRMGVRRFVIIDDVFNLNIKNSSRFFQLVLKNKLDVQFYFASGLRGDILTKEYMDLMVEAGTADIGLSLETASPRLQKFIRKNLHLDRFRENIEYLCKKYPHVILDLNTMHGFPSETEEEALMTLDFIKSLKWIHFPYLHILKIMHNTDMERLALESGISQEAIDASVNLAFHELPDTLPFDKSFTFSCQTDFLENYFLSKERLHHVLPFQMELLTEDDIVQKYNSYLPVDITSLDDLLKFVGISRNELRVRSCAPDSSARIPNLNEKLREHFHRENPAKDALRILLLDLSQFFSSDSEAIYNVAEPPLGLMYLLTYLQQEMGDRINGKIAKSRFDFDNYDELKALLDEFKPDVIGVRTLSYYKNFLHEAIAMIRSWGIDKTIIAGGPYASSEYKTLLQDRNIDLVVMGEGEITFHELIVKIIESGGKLPDERVLKEIPGLIFIDGTQEVKAPLPRSRDILLLDGLSQALSRQSPGNLEHMGRSTDPANIIVTAGPDGNLQTSPVSHRSVNRLIFNRRPALTLAASYVFDFSLPQWLGALVLGGTLCIPPAKPDDPDVRLVEFSTGKMEETQIRVVLKDKGLDSREGYKGPGNETEEKLVKIWSEILEIDRENISTDNNFFEIGGHSLKATTLIAFVHKTFNVKMKMTDIFKLPTIKEMAEFIKESTQEKYIAIEPAKEKKYYALSSAQKRVFIHHRMKLDSINYNMPSFMVMEGQLDKERFEAVFRELVRRHEIFRTAFVLIDDEPMQEIHQEVDLEVQNYQVEAEAETEEIINHFIRPFDLSRPPLLRIGLIKLPHHPPGIIDMAPEGKEDRYILMVDMHHIITDGTSIGIFVREFIALYSGKTLPGLRIQYKDFSEWQNQMYRSGEFKKQEEYWTKLFAGDIPVLNMPTDYPRSSARSFEGVEFDFEMDSSMTAKIKRSVLETETTLHIFLTAVFTVLLSKYSGQEDIVVGFGVAGRRHADLEHVMGLFVNILPLRSHPRKALTFLAFLEEVKKNALDAYTNQDYQYEELIMKLGLQGNPGRNPLFDFLFQIQNVEVPQIQLPGLNIKPYKKVIDLTRFDLVIHITETGDTINVRMNYSIELYKPSTIKKMGERFKEVLDQVVKDKEIQLKDISLTQELVNVTSTILQEEQGDFEF